MAFSSYESSHTRPTSVQISDSLFAPKPFSGSITYLHVVDSWLESFQAYVDLKGIQGHNRVHLFRLLMTDQAAIWLRSLPPHSCDTFDDLVEAFKRRYQISQADRWKHTAALFSSQQAPTQTVDDFISNMIYHARKLQLSDNLIFDLILKRLKSDIRLPVLQAQPKDISEILHHARIAQSAQHMADHSDSTPLRQITQQLDLLTKHILASDIKTATLPTPSPETNMYHSDQLLWTPTQLVQLHQLL